MASTMTSRPNRAVRRRRRKATPAIERPAAAAFVAGLVDLSPGAWTDIAGVCWDPGAIYQQGDAWSFGRGPFRWSRQDPLAVAITALVDLQRSGSIDTAALAATVARLQLAGIRHAADQARPASSPGYHVAISSLQAHHTPGAEHYGAAAKAVVSEAARRDLLEHSDLPYVRAIMVGTWAAIRVSAGLAAEALATDLPPMVRPVLLTPFAAVL